MSETYLVISVFWTKSKLMYPQIWQHSYRISLLKDKSNHCWWQLRREAWTALFLKMCVLQLSLPPVSQQDVWQVDSALIMMPAWKKQPKNWAGEKTVKVETGWREEDTSSWNKEGDHISSGSF